VSGSAAVKGAQATTFATARTAIPYTANLNLKLAIISFDSFRLCGHPFPQSVTDGGFLRQLLNTNRPIGSSE
jgi:hypothetical protein